MTIDIDDVIARYEQLPLTDAHIENAEHLLLARQIRVLMMAVKEYHAFAVSVRDAINTMQSAMESGQLGSTFITKLNPQFTIVAPKTPVMVIDKEVLERDPAGRVDRLREIHQPQPDNAQRSRAV